jgi:hypothetical protein
LRDGPDGGGVASFGEIRDALDQRAGHFTSDRWSSTSPFFMTSATRFTPK